MNAISAQNLSKTYGAVRALDRVSFSVDKGEVIGLLGPNGAGKTTLMKILTGYLQPDDGIATVHGIDVVGNPLQVKEKIGYLPETAPLYREMLVQDYLLMMADLRQIPLDKRQRLLSDAILATGLETYLTRPISALSKGYRQRVGIAQAILHRPEILILDEPTSGLDPTQIAEIRDLIKSLAQDATIFLSTHILSEVESTCERVLVIMKGRLRADSKLADLRAANAAVVTIENSAKDAQETLSKIVDVTSVEMMEAVGGFKRWRVTSNKREDLCPAIFDALRDKTWKVSELRSDAKTLERVFREMAESSVEVQR